MKRLHANSWLDVVAPTAVGLAYWGAVCSLARVGEPWDAAGYWTVWYPMCLVLAGFFGALSRRRHWTQGLPPVFTQLPIVWLHFDGEGSAIIGLLASTLLSLPAVLVAAVAGGLASRLTRGEMGDSA